MYQISRDLDRPWPLLDVDRVLANIIKRSLAFRDDITLRIAIFVRSFNFNHIVGDLNIDILRPVGIEKMNAVSADVPKMISGDNDVRCLVKKIYPECINPGGAAPEIVKNAVFYSNPAATSDVDSVKTAVLKVYPPNNNVFSR